MFQTSASFFAEFRGAMSSVENSFGKLLSDVVTDVRDTIGCTILAVKQVLALGGIFHESSEYDERCRGIKGAPTDGNAHEPPIILTTTDRPEIDSNKQYIADILTKRIDDPFQNVNVRQKPETVSFDRLTKVSTLLRRELSNIPEDVKIELSKLEADINNPTVQNIWDDIKILHNVESHHKDTQEGTRIHNLLKEILSILRGYDLSTKVILEVQNDEDNTFKQIEQQFLEMEQTSPNLKKAGDVDINTKSDANSRKPDDFPLTFKDVAKKIMDESRNFALLDDPKEKTESVTTNTETTSSNFDNGSVLELAPKNSQSNMEAVKEAVEIIEKSKDSDDIINDYLKKSSDIGTSVFDDILETGVNAKSDDKILDPDDLIVSFKDAAKTILEETSKTFDLLDVPQDQAESVSINSEATPKSERSNQMEDSENGSVFQLPPKDSQSRLESVNEAMELIDSKEKEIINNYFKKSNDIGTSVFDETVKTDVNSKSDDDNIFDPDDFTKSFKDAAKKILDDTSRTFLRFDDSQEQFGSDTTDTELTSTTDRNKVDSLENSDYSSAFELPPKNSPSRIEAVNEALELIEKSKENDHIVNDYFKKSSDIGTNVFENPDLLSGFGQ